MLGERLRGALAWLRRWKRLWTLLLVAGGVGAGGYFAYRQYKKRQLERVQLDLSTLAKVERGTLENKFEEVGDISSKKFLNVASRVSGRVVELHVREGQSVKAGQVLAVILPGKTGGEKYLPSTVTAPIGGILLRPIEEQRWGTTSKKFVALDDYVTGQFDNAQSPTPLLVIADMSVLIVKLQINEVDVLKFKEGLPVTVTLDSLPDEKLPGTVTMISKQAEEGRGPSAGKSFLTEVTLNRNDERLRMGMTARVSTVMEKKENVLKVSLSALFEEGGRTVAYLHVPEGQPREVEFKPGMRTALDVEILEGLKEGDQVFTEKPVAFAALEKKNGSPPPSIPAPASASAGAMKAL